ncbi:MAG: hypothetical protein JWM11_2233, partial [Planctomycetaceae bacterium]|nr:hypothetical protein [Planctomycetaceae bacterium]
SNLSVMPPNLAQQLSEADLKVLIAYLLRQKQAAANR